jgi:endonuclease YncB( thermonuclease family)
VRLILIDTPETHDPNNLPECYGAEATAFLDGLLPRASALYLETDVSERDRFGRLSRSKFNDTQYTARDLALDRSGRDRAGGDGGRLD